MCPIFAHIYTNYVHTCSVSVCTCTISVHYTCLKRHIAWLFVRQSVRILDNGYFCWFFGWFFRW